MIEFRAEHFSLDFENEKKWYPAVTDFNMHIDAGEMVALIGESGCGKSITALSMMGLQPPNTRIMGHMYLNGENGPEDLNELTKKEFLRENGVCNGDTTRRSDVYNNLYRKMQKKDRLAAGYTLEKYERIYRQAFYDAAKTADPNWEIGKPIKEGALDNVTRESIEAKKSLAQSTVDTKI